MSVSVVQLDSVSVVDLINQYSLLGAPFLLLVLAALVSRFTMKGGKR